MSSQSNCSFTPESTYSPKSSLNENTRARTPQHSRASSAAINAALREFLDPYGTLSSTPPSCQAVSFSSWSRFKATASTTPPGELKASVLCKGNGLAPSYNPPASEWTYLGANQPTNFGKPSYVRRSKHRRQRSSASWTTVSSTNDGETTVPIQFQKQPPKRVVTDSELTKSFEAARVALKQPSKQETMMKKLGLEGMKCEELPSAFSDSEDEED